MPSVANYHRVRSSARACVAVKGRDKRVGNPDLDQFNIFNSAVQQLDALAHRVVREHTVNHGKNVACAVPCTCLRRQRPFLKWKKKIQAMLSTSCTCVWRTVTLTAFCRPVLPVSAPFCFSAATIFSRWPILLTPTSFNASRSSSGCGIICTKVSLSVISSSSKSPYSCSNPTLSRSSRMSFRLVAPAASPAKKGTPHKETVFISGTQVPVPRCSHLVVGGATMCSRSMVRQNTLRSSVSPSAQICAQTHRRLVSYESRAKAVHEEQ